jgi:hypothetical protein
MFSERVILRFGDVARSASSPNLTVPCHFLWGQLTAKLCTNRLGTPEELKGHIRDGTRAIDKGLFDAVMVNFRSRFQEGIARKGDY